MRAFIIRPFGVKSGIDFEKVHTELIAPALRSQKIDIAGDTTTEIVQAGNIRSDMFELILAAELVIADISIHNANVFYELGIRHAVRAQKTILIRSRVEDVPYDLKTDRYLVYDNQNPSDSTAQLIDTIKQTIASDRKDSPVFALLPNLQAMDLSNLVLTPASFSEDLDLARESGDCGMLRLFLEETKGLTWQVGALRAIGTAAFDLKDFELAKDALEDLIQLYEDDVQANTLLGTVYQRLDYLYPQHGYRGKSSNALKRVLDSPNLSSYDRAEARSLLARNAKIAWEEEWKNQQDTKSKQIVALKSPHLDRCLKEYTNAYAHDRNHYFSGINALAMVQVKRTLCNKHPSTWNGLFDTDSSASERLKKLDIAANDLSGSVKLSIQTGIAECENARSSDLKWAEIALADYTFLTAVKPSEIADKYQMAMVGAENFHRAAVRAQILRYQNLDLFRSRCEAALEAIPDDRTPPSATPHMVVFTGHRIDNEDRAQPRFPADKEASAKKMIKQAIEKDIALSNGAPVVGISGAANGGDILFHEACAELDIPTQVYLALPERDYIAASVVDGGDDWVFRFYSTLEKSENGPPKTLSDDDNNPDWLAARRDYGVWQRVNLWMLHSAFSVDRKASLIALWDRKPGDGVGGTEDMVGRARERGARTTILDANKLLTTAD